jgi:hypothetical protein
VTEQQKAEALATASVDELYAALARKRAAVFAELTAAARHQQSPWWGGGSDRIR